MNVDPDTAEVTSLLILGAVFLILAVLIVAELAAWAGSGFEVTGGLLR